VIVVDPAIYGGADAFAALGSVGSIGEGGLGSTDLRECEALVIRSVDRIDAGVLDRAPQLRFVGSATAGIDHVDAALLHARGVEFAHAPGCNASAVAEWVLGALAWIDSAFVTAEPRVVGVVGCGAVGSRLVRLLRGLGHTVLRVDPIRERSGDEGPWTTLDDVCELADVVSLHVPLTVDGPAPTLGLIPHARAEAVLERRATLINTSRGSVLDVDPARLPPRGQGTLILDVWPHEPAVDPTLVRRADVAAPHVAGYSLRAKMSATAAIVGALSRHLGRGEPELEAVPEQAVDWDAAPVGERLGQVLGLAQDDRAMRSSAGRGSSDVATRFRTLRTDYRFRAELCDLCVKGASPETAAWLAAAGVRRFA
jgi:erythronate-4-phosphate dehydrogenase